MLEKRNKMNGELPYIAHTENSGKNIQVYLQDTKNFEDPTMTPSYLKK